MKSLLNNDEFYTLFEDVEQELVHYKPYLKDKIIYCNCDDSSKSAFWKYFHLNFKALGLKKLISTYYDECHPVYGMIYTGGDDEDIHNGVKIDLNGNGDFRSDECIELLKEADIIITNPPFSLFREYIALLMQYDKTFLIIGNLNAITYKEFFPLIKDNKIWTGHKFNKTMLFEVPDTYPAKIIENGKRYAKVPAICWYTNIDIMKRHEPLILHKTYAAGEYFRYDNYDAINVNRTADIPSDYYDIIGVPISFLDKYCPEQFEIIGASVYDDTPCLIIKEYAKMGYRFYRADGVAISNSGALKDKMTPKILTKGKGDFSVSPDGEYLSAIYQRIFIKRKNF